MAKKQNGGGNKKQRPSALKNTIMQEYKGDINLYVNMRTPMDMQKDAIRCFRDIAFGNLDLEFEGMLFLNPHFMQNASIACQTKYTQAYVRTKGEEVLLTRPDLGVPADLIQQNLTNDQATLQAYGIITQGLNGVAGTGDLEYLNVASAQINQNRLKYNL